VPDEITIRQVVTAWGRDTESGARAAITRLRYRARGADWGHPGANRPPLLLAHPTLSGAQLAVAGVCARLISAADTDEVYLVVPESVAALIRDIQETGTASWMPDSLHDDFHRVLPLLRKARIEVQTRRQLRHLHKLVASSRPDGEFQTLENAARQIRTALAGENTLPAPMPAMEPGWTCDWGHSRKYQGAAAAIVRNGAGGEVIGIPIVASVPTPPDLVNGELAAVLLAAAYARVMREACQVVYSDSRDTGAHLRNFVQGGRSQTNGALLAQLAAPFTDEELLAIDVRWIYRHSTPAHRAADVAARHMSRGEPVPAESVVDLEWLMSQML
jgi:hypothetical protein